MVKCWCGENVPDAKIYKHILKEHSWKDMVEYITTGKGVELDATESKS